MFKNDLTVSLVFSQASVCVVLSQGSGDEKTLLGCELVLVVERIFDMSAHDINVFFLYDGDSLNVEEQNRQ